MIYMCVFNNAFKRYSDLPVSGVSFFLLDMLQSLLGSFVKETLSNGFTLRRDKRGRLVAGDITELQLLDTGKQQVLPAMFTHQMAE